VEETYAPKGFHIKMENFSTFSRLFTALALNSDNKLIEVSALSITFTLIHFYHWYDIYNIYLD